MSQNPPPIAIQAVLPREEAVKLVFWQSPDEALFLQEDIAIVTGHTIGMLTLMRSGGGGPPYRKAKKAVWYEKGVVVRWMHKTSVEATNTGEAGAKREAMK